jgi:acyl-CoA synthetase (NDP forming)
VFGITPGLARALEHSKSVINKPLVAYIAQGGISKKLIALTQKAKIPAYQSPERAVRALKSLLSR